MAKATSLKLVPGLSYNQGARSEKSEALAKVRKNVESAVEELRSLGKNYEKAAWMLEDSLNYALNESDQSAVYVADGVDWASLIQAEELYSVR
jgi:hypothetical protein